MLSSVEKKKFDTGNIIVDALLSDKSEKALASNTRLDFKGFVPTSGISNADLCIIIANAVDNAIEACEKIKASDSTTTPPKFIRIYIGMFKQQLYISVSNSTNAKHRRRLNELVTSKLGEHGFGLRRIDKIAEQYDGFVNRKNEPGIFATEVMLPL